MSSDQIKIKGINAYGYHGVFDLEQQEGQEFYVDVILETDTSKAGFSDDLSRTINYAEVIETVVERIEGEPVQLIEALAEEIAELILERFNPEATVVTVHKPHAPVEYKFKDISLTIRRVRHEKFADTEAVPSLALKHQAARKANSSKLLFDTDDVKNPYAQFSTVIALGANLGNRKVTLRKALEELDRNISMRLQRVSPVYESAPVGGPEQPPYLNMVAEFITTLSPQELLELAHEVENSFGRTRDVRWGARTLDVDIITYGNKKINEPNLIIPHPRAHERAFVLVPWHRMNPEAIFPTGERVSELMTTSIGIQEIEEYRGE